MDVDQLKHKLRGLKKVEDRIRFMHIPSEALKKYIWDDYFSTRSIDDQTVRYPISKLLMLNKQAFKEVFEEYFYSVFFQMYRDSGLDFDEIQDPGVLSYFGLAPGASADDISKKFRELAKKYHPDCGGSNEKMQEVLEAYHKALRKNSI